VAGLPAALPNPPFSSFFHGVSPTQAIDSGSPTITWDAFHSETFRELFVARPKNRSPSDRCTTCCPVSGGKDSGEEMKIWF
jgi:hypothetical protein